MSTEQDKSTIPPHIVVESNGNLYSTICPIKDTTNRYIALSIPKHHITIIDDVRVLTIPEAVKKFNFHPPYVYDPITETVYMAIYPQDGDDYVQLFKGCNSQIVNFDDPNISRYIGYSVVYQFTGH